VEDLYNAVGIWTVITDLFSRFISKLTAATSRLNCNRRCGTSRSDCDIDWIEGAKRDAPFGDKLEPFS
jgi:hypothetical protein